MLVAGDETKNQRVVGGSLDLAARVRAWHNHKLNLISNEIQLRELLKTP
jgi:hypothetical protein